MSDELSLAERLQEPFDPSEVKWKPQSVKNNRALAVAYADARVVMDRLDDVFGVGGWQTSYRPGENKTAVCTLKVKVNGEWITHENVGAESDQPDETDREKSAFSDALKRTAVELGIGRYLYRLPHQWVDYDPAKRQFASTPKLPTWALPKPRPQQKAGDHITREQWEQIKAELTKQETPLRAFLDHFAIQKAGDLPLAHFKEALAMAQKPASEWGAA